MLAAALNGQGHHVVWLSANFHHARKAAREMQISDNLKLDIHLVTVPPYKNNISPARIRSHLVYAQQIHRLLYQIHSVAPLDVVVSSIPPIVSTYHAMRFCAEKKVIGVIDLQDAWPQALELALPTILRKAAHFTIINLLERLVTMSTNRASALVAVSNTYLSYLTSFTNNNSSIPRMVFPLGFDTAVLNASHDSPSFKPADTPLQVIYIGTFGRFYDLETVIYAASLCKAHPIQFVLIGDGPKYAAVTTLAEKLNLANVTFTGRIPFEEALPFLRRSHLGLVPLTADWPPSVPNKMFDYLSIGLPVLFSTTGELETELDNQGLGFKYRPEDADSLAMNLIKLCADGKSLRNLQNKTRTYFQSRMDGAVIYEKYAAFLENLFLARR